MMRFGNLIIGAAFMLGLSGSHSAPVSAVHTLNARESWAESLSNESDGIFFTAVGARSTTLLVAIFPKDATGCDSVIFTLAVRQDFLQDAYARGFRSVECVADLPDGSEQIIERNIVPRSPEPSGPTVPPSTELDIVPMKHDRRVTDVRA
jgi:hypothetical protein